MLKNNLDKILVNEGISINRMAKDLGVRYATIHNIVTIKKLDTITLENIVKIADYLNKDIKELYTQKGEIEVREEIKSLDARYEEIREKLNVAKANGDLSKLYNLREEFDESFDQFFDEEDLRRKYDDWDEEEQQPLFNESNTTLLEKLDEEDLEAYIEFYEEVLGYTEDELNELLEGVAVDPYEFEEIKTLNKAIDLVAKNSHTGSATDEAYKSINELTDDIEEYGSVDSEKLRNAKKAIIDSARYAGYTNVQYNLQDDIRDMLDGI